MTQNIDPETQKRNEKYLKMLEQKSNEFTAAGKMYDPAAIHEAAVTQLISDEHYEAMDNKRDWENLKQRNRRLDL